MSSTTTTGLAAAALAAAACAALPGAASAAFTTATNGSTYTITSDDAGDFARLVRDESDPNKVRVVLAQPGGLFFLPGPIDRTVHSTVQIDLGGGDDELRLDNAGGTFPAGLTIVARGGGGNDQLHGSDGAQTLLGGPGNDVIDGNGGNDAQAGQGGDDTIVWDPGDGSDVADGGAGRDTLRFNGAAGAEAFALSVQEGRLRVLRAPGAIDLDVQETEVVEVNALGGDDLLTLTPDVGATGLQAVPVTGLERARCGVGAPEIPLAGPVDVLGAVCVPGAPPAGSGPAAPPTPAPPAPPVDAAPLPPLPPAPPSPPAAPKPPMKEIPGLSGDPRKRTELKRTRLVRRTGLRVTVANPATVARTVTITATETVGGRRFRYPVVRRRLAAGAQAEVKLAVPKALRDALARRGVQNGARRPRVTVREAAAR